MKTLSSIASQIRGVTYKKEQAINSKAEGYLPLLRAGNIQDSSLNHDDLVYVPSHLVKPKQLLKKGDVLIATSSGSLSVVGKAGVVDRNLEASFGAFCKVLRIDTDEIYPPYFGYFFETSKYKNTVRSLAAGANINNLKTEHFDSLEIPLPPLEVQKKIAAILDEADALRQKTKALIAKYDELAQSLFLEMFGDPVTNPKGWELKRLGDLGNLKNGLNYSKQESAFMIKCLGVGNFKDHYKIESFDDVKEVNTDSYPTQDYLLKDGDILFVRSNGNNNLVARCIVTYPREEISTFSGFTIRFRITLNIVIPIYLTFLFRNIQFRKRVLKGGRGANIQNINQQILSQLSVPVPMIRVQEDFAKAVQQIDQAKLNLKQSHLKSEDTFNSLIQKAFKGNLIV